MRTQNHFDIILIEVININILNELNNEIKFDESKLKIRNAKIEDYRDICKISCDDLGYNCDEKLVKQRL